MKKYISYLGLLSILVYAYLLDYGIALLRKAGVQSFVLMPYLWGGFLANLFLAIGILGLFWLLLVRRSMSKITGLIFVIVGLAMTFYPALARGVPGLLSFMHADMVEFSSKLSVASAFVVVMGFWGLLFSTNSG